MKIKRKNIGSNEPATKGDLEDLREDLHGDMADMESRITSEIAASESRFERKLDSWGRILFDKIEGAIENRAIELGGAAVADVSALRDQVQGLDGRVTSLEKRRA